MLEHTLVHNIVGVLVVIDQTIIIRRIFSWFLILVSTPFRLYLCGRINFLFPFFLLTQKNIIFLFSLLQLIVIIQFFIVFFNRSSAILRKISNRFVYTEVDKDLPNIGQKKYFAHFSAHLPKWCQYRLYTTNATKHLLYWRDCSSRKNFVSQILMND